MPKFTESEVSYAKTTLSYPIWAVDFDPYDRGFLVVGGGGGESKTGVSNQISVLDVSNRAAISTAIEIDLSRSEDSVSSIANLATKDGLIALAGINSSAADQNAGNNQHFRSFGIQYPPRKKQKTEGIPEDVKAHITPLGKRSLFKPSTAAKKETYQRLLRLSPASMKESGSKRIGAIASGLAKQSEVIVFNATVNTPETADILAKIDLPENSEAADLDIATTDVNEFSVAYCDDHGIYEQTFNYDFEKKKTQRRPSGPRRVHQMPFPDAFESAKSRAKYRALRFLNSQNVIVLQNRPNKAGAELRIYHLYPTGPAIEIGQMKLPRHVKAAASLDVCALDADENGAQQFVVAVAAQDISIEVYTVDYQPGTDTFSKIRNYNTFRNVHDQQMTKICFAPFYSPVRAPDPGEIRTTGANGEPVPYQKPATLHPLPQYIKLASVSYGNTVVVDTFPLTPLDPTKKSSRYVLVHPDDEAFWRWALIFIGAFVVLVLAFVAQAFGGGFSDDDGGAGIFGLMPRNVREFLDQPVAAAYGRQMTKVTPSLDSIVSAATDGVPAPSLRSESIADYVARVGDAGTGAVVINDVPEGDGLDVQVQHDKQAVLTGDASAKHWHELEDHQKSALKEKLIRAGRWAEHEGEAVLQGCLWSTYAGLVGQAAGEVLREL